MQNNPVILKNKSVVLFIKYMSLKTLAYVSLIFHLCSVVIRLVHNVRS